jgi:hypothetical protein
MSNKGGLLPQEDVESRALQPVALHYNKQLKFMCFLYCYLSMQWSRTESTVTVAIYWPVVTALDDRWC